MAAFNAAFDQYEGDEEKAFGTAWAAVKNKYRKEGDRWVAKGGEHMEGKWIAVFRTGRHTDSAGNTKDWTEKELDHIANAYNPAEHEAPIVIGHPKTDDPAYGWVAGLKREGETLYAKFKQLVPEFVDMVKRGLFSKRSIAVYPDLTLKHIGFLGAAAPAVKGLPNVKFERDEQAAIIEFAATDEQKEAQQKRSKKYNIAIKEGGNVTKPSEWDDVPDDDFLDPVNYRYPCPDADQTRAAASYWGKPKNKAQYSAEEQSIINKRLEARKKKFNIGQEGKKPEGGSKMSMKSRLLSIFSKGIENLPDDDPLLQPDEPRTFTEAELKAKADEAAEKARKEEKERIEKEYAENQKKAQVDARKAEINTWCEEMQKPAQGKLVPAVVKSGIPEIMEFLAASTDVIEFGEKKEKTTLYDLFKNLFEVEIPKYYGKPISYGEHATGDKDTGGQGNAGEKLSKLTREKMKEQKDLTYGQAFAEIQRENPDLAKEYAQEIKGRA